LVAMLIAFLWFYGYSRTPEWGDSETRKAVLRMLIVIGPIFGMHYRAPRPEPTDDLNTGRRRGAHRTWARPAAAARRHEVTRLSGFSRRLVEAGTGRSRRGAAP